MRQPLLKRWYPSLKFVQSWIEGIEGNQLEVVQKHISTELKTANNKLFREGDRLRWIRGWPTGYGSSTCKIQHPINPPNRQRKPALHRKKQVAPCYFVVQTSNISFTWKTSNVFLKKKWNADFSWPKQVNLVTQLVMLRKRLLIRKRIIPTK